MKIWYYLCRIPHNEFSGVLFFKVLEGHISEPASLVLEVVDFYLMDVGSSGFTSFKWTPEIADYQMEHPEHMEDGVRTGCLHSHHTMGTFFSGEDLDDLIINTRDKEVDFYVSVIVNAKGEWISRLAYRVQEEVERKATSRFWTSLVGFEKFKLTRTDRYSAPCLYMVDLPIEMLGSPELDELGKRMDSLSPKYPVHYGGSPYAGRYPYPQSGSRFDEKATNGREKEEKGAGSGGRQLKLPLTEEETKEMEKQAEEDDLLLGKLLMGSGTWMAGLDAAVQAFRRKTSDKDGKPFENTIHLHAEQVVVNASRIIRENEGFDVAHSFIVQCLDELSNVLLVNYAENEKSDVDCIDMFCDALDDLIEMFETGKLDQEIEMNS